MSKILSIIIPTYNMEKYVGQCLASMTSPEVPDTLEVIAVNDGSKDGSLAILNSFREKRPDIVKVIDKPNGNYGSCINAALPQCTGKYVRIVDADDWVETKNLVKLIGTLEDCNADVIISNYTKYYQTSERMIIYSPQLFVEGSLDIEDVRLREFNASRDFVMHSMTFSKTLLDKCHLSHTEGISYTDFEYVYYPLMDARTILMLDVNIYNYRIGREGQTINIDQERKHALDWQKIANRIVDSYTISNGKNLRRFQIDLAARAISSYYWSIIVIKARDEHDYYELRLFDKKLKNSDIDLYNKLNEVRCIGVKYIDKWRKTNNPPFPWWLYAFLKRLRP